MMVSKVVVAMSDREALVVEKIVDVEQCVGGPDGVALQTDVALRTVLRFCLSMDEQLRPEEQQ